MTKFDKGKSLKEKKSIFYYAALQNFLSGYETKMNEFCLNFQFQSNIYVVRK